MLSHSPDARDARLSRGALQTTIGLSVVAAVTFLAGFTLFHEPEVRVDAFATAMMLFVMTMGVALAVAFVAQTVLVARVTASKGIVRGTIPGLIGGLVIIAVVSVSAMAGMAVGSELDVSRVDLEDLGGVIATLGGAAAIGAVVGCPVGLVFGAISHHAARARIGSGEGTRSPS